MVQAKYKIGRDIKNVQMKKFQNERKQRDSKGKCF